MTINDCLMNQQYKCKYDFDKYIQDNSNVDLRSMGSTIAQAAMAKQDSQELEREWSLYLTLYILIAQSIYAVQAIGVRFWT